MTSLSAWGTVKSQQVKDTNWQLLLMCETGQATLRCCCLGYFSCGMFKPRTQAVEWVLYSSPGCWVEAWHAHSGVQVVLPRVTFFTLCTDHPFFSQAPSQASVTLKVASVTSSRIRKETRPTGCESEDAPPPPTPDPEETTPLGWVSGRFSIPWLVHDDTKAGWHTPLCDV